MKFKLCKNCRKNLPVSHFYKCNRSGDGFQYECKPCSRARYHRVKKKWHALGVLGYSQRTRQRLRFEVIVHYGGKCACCGESNIEFLGIDHINGGGRAHRKSIGESGLYCWLKRNNFPKGFRVLCHNCNQALGAYGYCPHRNPEKRLTCPPKTAYERSHCKRGHALTPDNVLPNSNGWKYCKICRKITVKKFLKKHGARINKARREKRRQEKSRVFRFED